MKLFFYSKLKPDIHLDLFNQMNSNLMKLVKDSHVKVGYIASQHDPSRFYFKKAQDFYTNLGIHSITYFGLETEYDASLETDLFQSDIIHLSSGNTYTFLHNLQKRNLLPKLKEYALNDGIIVGVSAGCHILCDTISAAQFGDRNNVNLRDLTGLGLVYFKVIPHWNNKKDKLDDIKNLSNKENSLIYLIEDGNGIVVSNDHIYFYGNITKIKKE